MSEGTSSDPRSSDPLFQQAPVLVALLDCDGRIERVNPCFERITGSHDAQLRGRAWHEVVPAAPPELAPGKITSSLLTKAGDRCVIEWHTSLTCDPEGVATGALCVGVDVTERDRAVDRVSQIETYLNEAQRIAKVGSWELDLVDNRLTWSDEIFRIFEIDKTLFGASYDAFLAAVHPDDRADVDRAYTSSIATRRPYEITHRLRMLDGRIKWVHERCETFYSASGKALRSVGTVQDISERVIAERALAERDTAYRQLNDSLRLKDDTINASLNAVAFANVEGEIAYANRAFLRLWGFDREGEIVGRPIADFWVDRVERARVLRDTLASGGGSGEALARRKDGSTFVALWSVMVLHNEAGAPARLIGFFLDISERMRAEERLALVFNSTSDMQVLVRAEPDGRLVLELANRAYLDCIGRAFPDKEHDIVGRDRDDVLRSLGLTQQEIAEEVSAYRQVLEQGIAATYEIQLRAPDGDVAIEVSLGPVRDLSGKCTHVLWTGRDITARNRSQAELRRVGDLLRSVVDSSPDWIFAKDSEHRFLLVNQVFARAQGVTPDEMLGRLDTDFWTREHCEGDPERSLRGYRDDDRDAMQGSLVRNSSDHTTLSDGARRVFDTFKGPLRDEHGRIYGVLAYARDVTEQRELADAQRRSLQENEILLREIHHRVKNNLQIIASLLHFHVKKARVPFELSVLEEVRKRLFAMILVHEKLFRSKHLATVELGDYARSLTGTLVQSFEGRGRIGFEVVSDDVQLPIETALPAGMILCELVTNVFKYAFPGERAGHAIVSTRREGDEVLMAVDDDGVGFPAGFDPHTAESFGFYLVRTLVSQLDGTLAATTNRGAHLLISFPIPRAPATL